MIINSKNQEAPRPPNPKTNSGGLFGSPKDNSKLETEVQELRQEVNSLTRRIREIEEKNQNQRKKLNVIDTNIMNQSKKISTETKIMYSEIDELKHILEDFDNKMLLMIKEIKQCAKDQDLKVLQKYMEIWEPMRFVTRNEVKKIIKDIIEDMSKNR
jgi:predicted RNase H-like nuclease (RuvC/YqgF family)